jgi:hypothetical protein
MRTIRTRLRADELWARWLELAGELELPPGERDDLGWPAGSIALHAVADCEDALDRLVARARRRLPRYRLDPERLTIVANPRASAGDVMSIARGLAAIVDAKYRAAAVNDLEREAERGGLTAARVARRWGTTRGTLFRWAAEARVSKTLANRTLAPEIEWSNQLDVESGPGTRAWHHITEQRSA